MEYKEISGKIEAAEPKISGQSVSEFVNHIIDRLGCFVEEISVYALQAQMPSGISVTEIPLAERKAECPERFQATFVSGGRQIWNITFHVSKFEET